METLDFFDNLMHRERYTEQADAITFDGEVGSYYFLVLFFPFTTCLDLKVISTYIKLFSLQIDRVYLDTPTKIAIIDHEKKRTFELRKEGMPDSGY